MIENLNKDQQQKLAIGILALLIILVATVVLVPVWRINHDYASQITTMQTRLQTLQSRAEADEALRPGYEQLVRSHATSGHHLKSDTEAVAAAELQRIVKSITAGNGTQILTTQILPATDEAEFVRVTLKVRVRGPYEGIVQSIYDIEASQTFLFLDNLSIRDGARRRIRGTAEINQFDGDFDLIAYMPKSI
jgi:Tfp pilus assembly protein PilO